MGCYCNDLPSCIVLFNKRVKMASYRDFDKIEVLMDSGPELAFAWGWDSGIFSD